MAIALAVTPAAQADPVTEADPSTVVDVAPAAVPSDLLGQLEAANEQLKELGISPFLWPTAAINCSQVPGAPLGIVPGVAGAVAGPTTPILGDLTLENPLPGGDDLDLNAVKKGEVFYGFFPAGIVDDSADKSGMSLGWFNINTFDGGFVPMGSLTSTILEPIKARVKALALPAALQALADAAVAQIGNTLDAIPQAGTRAAVVETGSGTVLSIVLGSVKHSTGTCYFLPTVGIQTVD